MGEDMSLVRLIYNEYEESLLVLDELKSRFDSIGIKYVYESMDNLDKNNKCDINIVIGGDGTFLKSVRSLDFPDELFVGINTGKLGFFQEIWKENIPKLIHIISTGEFSINKLKLLSLEAYKTDGTKENFYAINEFLVRGDYSKVTHLDLYIDDIFVEKFSGDGLIISSSIGSTAYNFSVGGSVVNPKLEIMQVAPLAPISSSAYRSLLNSIITPEDSVIKIVPNTKYFKDIIILRDGEEIIVKDIKDLKITLDSKTINRLIVTDDSYWNNLRDKFI